MLSAVMIAVLMGLACVRAGEASTGLASAAEVAEIADDLLRRAKRMPGGGLAWLSVIQAPHLHTDRDVGAAGVGLSLLAAAQITGERRFLDGSRHAGDWLLAVSHDEPHDGRSWPDWAEPDGTVSKHRFLSFDDGAPGISEFLWRLSVATGDQRYANAARQGMNWVLKQARCTGAASDQKCWWPWLADGAQAFTGLGMGTAGIVWALQQFSQWTDDRRYAEAAQAGGRWLLTQQRGDGALPGMASSTDYNTGYLSGAAGHAFTFVMLWRATHEERYRSAATRSLRWLIDQEQNGAWPVMRDPIAGDDTRIATGFEEGSAGIGWVLLEAAKALDDSRYLEAARRSARFLRRTAHVDEQGARWPEYAGEHTAHISLNNGTAGIAWFLADAAVVADDPRNARLADRAAKWLLAVRQQDDAGGTWGENADHFGRGGWRLIGEPSWHWGHAGVLALAARRSGWPMNIPGMQPGF